MKVKKLVLISEDEYEDCEMNSVRGGVLPEELDAMVELSFGRTKIYINTSMIVSLELERDAK